MPKLTLTINLPKTANTNKTYPVNIDFDEASKQWRIHTMADDPKALRRRQRAYWRGVRRAERKAIEATACFKVVKRKRGARKVKPVKRLIDEC